MNARAIKRKANAPPAQGEIRLCLKNPVAKKVAIAGTFNNWQPTDLIPEGEGTWALTLTLPPGQYEYRFIVDEQWTDDPLATEFIPNIYGGINCIFTVPARV